MRHDSSDRLYSQRGVRGITGIVVWGGVRLGGEGEGGGGGDSLFFDRYSVHFFPWARSKRKRGPMVSGAFLGKDVLLWLGTHDS